MSYPPEEISRRRAARYLMSRMPTPTAGDVRGVVGLQPAEFQDLALIARALNNNKRARHDRWGDDNCGGR